MEKRWEELLTLAVKKKASDIHFTEKDSLFHIEMRIQGKMIKIPSKPEDKKLLPFLQYMANLDVGSSVLPQTGQFEMFLQEECFSLRFALLRRPRYSSGVVRILNHHLTLDGRQLSHLPSQNRLWQKSLQKKAGLILLCGATGSGKTTSLYSLLRTLTQKKVYSLEDPIERYFGEFMQWQINENIGFDYNEGIKQILRHDPDVVVIGEIRDEKAAKGALRMAQTGHLVISTLHAHSLATALGRMQELGVNLESLLAVLLLVSCQKLYDYQGHKFSLYEMFTAEDIHYFQTYQSYPASVIDLKSQERALRKRGLL